MGRTYKNSDREWGNKSLMKTKVKKKKQGVVKPPLTEVPSEDNNYYDELEMEAYDEEFSDKIRRRGSNKF